MIRNSANPNRHSGRVRGSSSCFTLFILATFAIVIFLAGCVNSYTVKPDLIKNFQEPQVPADKTGIYLIRGANFYGGARGLWVAVNDAVVADLANSSHTYLELDAGINSVHFVQAKAGFGYLAVDNKPGELIYAKFDYAGTNETEVLPEDLGQTMVMETTAVQPLAETRVNDAYDNLVINPGLLNYPIMKAATVNLAADGDHAVVRFYRQKGLLDTWEFDVWSQDGYIGSTSGGDYFSVKLRPGRHEFIALSEHYAVLAADLEANKTYAVELRVGMGWNQAHVKLLPIDLSTNSGAKKVKDWMGTFYATQVDTTVVESAPIAARIKIGREFLADTYQKIASGELATRKLPVNFGRLETEVAIINKDNGPVVTAQPGSNDGQADQANLQQKATPAIPVTHPSKVKAGKPEQTSQPQKKVAALTPKSSQSASDSRLKLAVFPWKFIGAPGLSYSDDYFISIAIDAAGDFINNTPLSSPVLSYYKLDNAVKAKPIDKSILGRREINRVWMKRGFFSDPEPNTQLICNLGKQLAVDAVLVYFIRVDRGPDDLVAYLVDVHKNRVYRSNGHCDDFKSSEGYDALYRMTKKVFADF